MARRRLNFFILSTGSIALYVIVIAVTHAELGLAVFMLILVLMIIACLRELVLKPPLG